MPTCLQFLGPPGSLNIVLHLPRDDAESLRAVVEAVLVIGQTSAVLPLQPVEVALEDVLAESAHRTALKQNREFGKLVLFRVSMVSLTGQIVWTGYSKDRSRPGKTDPKQANWNWPLTYIMVRILEPVTIWGLADRSDP